MPIRVLFLFLSNIVLKNKTARDLKQDLRMCYQFHTADTAVGTKGNSAGATKAKFIKNENLIFNSIRISANKSSCI